MLMSGKNLNELYDNSDSEDDEEKRTLFCANLDERVTVDLLYEVFLQAGPIESVRIPKNYGGKQRTFGFVTYVHKSTLPYAMQLFQGLTLYRKTLTIKQQGGTQPLPMINHSSPHCSNIRSAYDNSSLRGTYSSFNDSANSSLRIGSFSSYNDSPTFNPFKTNCSPDYSLSSVKQQDNLKKHASSHRRHHADTSPYQRKSSNHGDRRESDRDHNRRRHYNDGSSSNSGQRFSRKTRI